MNKKTYISPELVIEDIELETMICSKSDVDMDIQEQAKEWNDETEDGI